MTTTVTHAETAPAPPPTSGGQRRFLPWVRQAHVVLGIMLLVKLFWFNGQVDVKFASPALFMVTLGSVLLVVAPLPLLRPRARLVAIFAINLAVSALVLADLVYYRYFFGLITVSTLQQSGQAAAVSDSITALLQPSDAWLFADITVMVVIAARRGVQGLLRPAGEFRSRRSIELVVFAVLIGLTFVAVPVESQRRNGDAFDSWWDMATYQFTGLVGFHVYDAGRFARQEWFQPGISTSDLTKVEARFDERPTHSHRSGSPRFGEFSGANVLMVQVEALQTMALGSEVGGKAVTPTLNALRNDSIYFPNFFHQVSSGRTSDAEFLADCSLQPARFGTAFFRYVSNEFRCTPEVLAEAGYSTAVHHAYQGSFWNRNTMYPELGFDRFFALKDYEVDEPVGWSIGDRSFLEQTVHQLADRPRPFYDKAITLSSHHPYDLPRLEPDLDVGELDGTMLGDYLRVIHYVDDSIDTMIEELKSTGLWDNTIVVIYGDHDAGIHDRDALATFLGHEPTDFEMEVGLRSVPLLIHLPNNSYSGAELTQPSGEIDLAPTLRHLLGIPETGLYTLGSDRFSKDRAPVVFRDGGFVDADRFFVPGTAGDDDGLCFNRITGRRLDAQACAEGFRTAGDQLEISDLVLDHDLVPDVEDE